MPYNEKSKEYHKEYAKKNLKRVPLDLKIKEYAALKKYVDEHGENVNGFLRRIIKENIQA